MFRQGGRKVVEGTGRKTIFCSHWNFAKAIIRLEEFLVSALVDIYLTNTSIVTLLLPTFQYAGSLVSRMA